MSRDPVSGRQLSSLSAGPSPTPILRHVEDEASAILSRHRALSSLGRVGDSLETIAAQVSSCRSCVLCEKRIKPVPGEGCPSPDVLIVGEGPGAEEDERGRPFVGPAGQLLDKMLAAIGLSRERNAFIANVVKCRPPMNRDPAPEEQEACAPFLMRQIAVLKPRAILCVGRVPSQSLLATREPVTRLRGSFHDFHGVPLLCSYHPSALLRNEDLKRPAWEDLKLLKQRLDERG